MASLRIATRRFNCPSYISSPCCHHASQHQQRRWKHSDDSKKGKSGVRNYSKKESDDNKEEGKPLAARPFLDSLLGLLGRKPEPVKHEKEVKERPKKAKWGAQAAAGEPNNLNWSPLSATTQDKSNDGIGDADKDAASPPAGVGDFDSSSTITKSEAVATDPTIIPASSLIPIPNHLLNRGPKAPPTYLVQPPELSSRYYTSRQSKEELASLWEIYQQRGRKQDGNMKSYIQFVTVPTGDTAGTCIMLHYDHRRYLFGHIGEGTMRACNEMGLSLRKVQKIFISGRTTRETSGGLLGMLLTLADANQAATANAVSNAPVKEKKKKESTNAPEENTDINVYGPTNLVHSVAAARKFIFRKSTPTTIRDLGYLKNHNLPDGFEEEQSSRVRPIDAIPRIMDNNIDVFPIIAGPRGDSATMKDAEAEVLKLMAKKRTYGDGTDDENDLVRQRIINDMFNSKWRLDTLVEKYLHEVELPAKIWYRDQETKDLKEYDGPLPPDPKASRTLKVFVRNPWPAAMAPSLPSTSPSQDAVSYIVRGRVTRGKFDKAKALELGLKPGPQFSKLATGNAIKLDDGRTINPEQVLGPDIQAGGFALVDLPTDAYAERHAYVYPTMVGSAAMAGVKTMIWLLGPGVLSNEKLKKYVRDRTDITHVISSPDYNTNQLVAHGAAASAIKLAQVDKDHFPIPYFDDKTTPAPNFRRESGIWPKEADPETDLFALPNVILAQRGLTVQLDPEQKVEEKDIIPPLDTLELITSPQSAEVIELAKEVRESALTGPLASEMQDWRNSMPYEGAEIITLGTGSAMPSRYRNVSATLVQVPGWGSYLLDAGENTLGQLQRVFKPTELVEVLKDLRMIWISHGHADHHLGTVSMIKAWYDVVHGGEQNTDNKYAPVTPEVVDILKDEFDSNPMHEPPSPEHRPKYLAVMGNRFLMDYLREISQVEDFGFSHVLPVLNTNPVSNASPSKANALFNAQKIILFSNGSKEPWFSRNLGIGARLGFFGVRAIRAINVRHCNGARALYMRFGRPPGDNEDAEPFSIAYSGDCRPSSAFAEAARGAKVLIHEATFDDDLGGEARAKKHSTVQEAIGVASLMGAKSLVLTHFSQRYQKIPVLEDVWGKAAVVEEEIKRESGDVREDGRGAKGPGAGEDVDEIAEGAEEIPSATAGQEGGEAAAEVEEPDEMDTDPTAEEAVSSEKEREIPILFAFDYMRVRVSDMPMLKAYRPALTKLFETEIGELEERKAKRAENAALEAAGLKRSSSSRSLNASGGKAKGGNSAKKVKMNAKATATDESGSDKPLGDPALESNKIRPVTQNDRPESESCEYARSKFHERENARAKQSQQKEREKERDRGRGRKDASQDGFADLPHEL